MDAGGWPSLASSRIKPGPSALRATIAVTSTRVAQAADLPQVVAPTAAPASGATPALPPAGAGAAHKLGAAATPISAEPDLPVTITPGMGVGVREVDRTRSRWSDAPLIWLEKVSDWSAGWDTPDISADSQWGVGLLGPRAAAFGFEGSRHGEQVRLSMPSPAHANWAIDRFNARTVAAQPERAIPLKLTPVAGIQSAAEFLEGYTQGIIPVALDAPRTYLHDINYHLIAAVAMRPEAIQSWQRRTRLVLDFVADATAKRPDDPMVRECLPKVLEIMSSRVDQTGNWVGLMAAARTGDDTAPVFAQQLRDQLASADDATFVRSLIEAAAAFVPAVTYFEYQKKLSKKDAEQIRADYPAQEREPGTWTDSSKVYVEATLGAHLQEFLAARPPQGEDAEVERAMDSLGRYLVSKDPKESLHWIRSELHRAEVSTDHGLIGRHRMPDWEAEATPRARTGPRRAPPL